MTLRTIVNRAGKPIDINRQFFIDELTWVSTVPQNKNLISKAITSHMIGLYGPKIIPIWEKAYGEKDDNNAKEELNDIYWAWLHDIKRIEPRLNLNN